MATSNQTLAIRVERGLLLGGPAMAVTLLAALLVTGFIPPLRAYASATDVAAYYASHQQGLIGGGILLLIASSFLMAFCGGVTSAMRRHEPDLAILADLQFAGAIVNTVYFALVGLVWLTAAYRLDALPTETRLFNDLGWIIMVVPTTAFMLQLACIALVAFAPAASERAIPRWIGFFSMFCFMLDVPGMFSGFFKTGPIAWHGLLSFWLEAISFGVWLGVMFVALRQQSRRSI